MCSRAALPRVLSVYIISFKIILFSYIIELRPRTYSGNAATNAISRQRRYMCYIAAMPLMDAVPLHVLHMAAMPQRLPYMAAMPRHGGNAATWRQCRDMAAMPRHVLHPVHRGNAAANDRRSHVYARMHTCTHVLSFLCTHEKPNTTAARIAAARICC